MKILKKNFYDGIGNSSFFFWKKNSNLEKKRNILNYWSKKIYFNSYLLFLKIFLEQKKPLKKKKNFTPQTIVIFFGLRFQENYPKISSFFLKFQEESFGSRYIMIILLFIKEIFNLGKIFLFCKNDFRILKYYKKKESFFFGEILFQTSLVKKYGLDTQFFKKYFKNFMRLLNWSMKFLRKCEIFKNLIILSKKKKKIEYNLIFFF